MPNAKKSSAARVPGQSTYAAETGNAGISVVHYDLDLDYRVNTNRLAGTATLLIDASEDLERFALDLVGLTTQSVTVDGTRARFTHSGGVLRVVPARTLPSGSRFTAVVRYSGAPSPRRSAWGEVGWEELSDGVLVAGQPNGAPTWFPCNDHPSDKATYRISITAASSYRVVANGVLTSTTTTSSRTRNIFETAEPMATYLVTLQVGAYRARSLGDDPVRQLAFLPDDLDDDFGTDFGRQAEMIETFASLFGPYPFEQYSVVVTDDELEIPLEAQGMSVFGRNHVDGNHGSDRLIAHELAHSWFGNSLTASTWRDIWLHEGFACYAEWLWSEASGGATVAKLADQYWHRLSALPQDLAIGDPGPARMFDDRVYKRGALALHSVRLALGDSVFFDLLRAWTDQHRHGSVSTEEFLDHVDSYARSSLRPSLDRWLFTHPLPRLDR